MNHLLGIKDFTLTAEETDKYIFDLATQFKANRTSHEKPLLGQTWNLIFSKSSTRTRLSFEVGVYELGANGVFLNTQDIQLGRGEPIIDTARVMGRMTHGAVIRTYDQRDVEDFAQYSEIPTINALTDDEHPCQILTDLFTIKEKLGAIKGKKIAFIGDADCNVANSFAYAAPIFDYKLNFAAPISYQSKIDNNHIETFIDPFDATKDVDVIYTDVWISMGKEEESEKRLKEFHGYQINKALVKEAKKDALVLHCLPAYRDKEISEEILEERATDIFDQAENRLHTQKAILSWLNSSRAT
ncbi:MAG: ornithine carbamoyltransferase [Verrucomicrobiota bacterium]